MGKSGVRSFVAGGVGAAAAGAIAFVFAATGGAGQHASTRTAPERSCGSALVADWSDGRIDRDYPIACYRAALRSLPADLQVYSSAPDDITHALSQRIIQSAGKRGTARTLAR